MEEKTVRMGVMALHITLLVYSVLGCILSATDFGMDRREFGMKTFDDIVRPGNFSEKQYSKLSDEERSLIDGFTDDLDNLARIHYDQKSYSLTPFLVTMLVSSYFMAARFVLTDIFGSTAVLNSCIMMWFIHVYYFLSFLNDLYHPTKAFKLFKEAVLPGVVTLHTLILVILAAFIVGCGKLLRFKAVQWPRCNCLGVFTIDRIFSVIRFAFCIISAAVFEGHAGYGVRDSTDSSFYCVLGVCGRRRFSEPLFFSCLSVFLVAVVFAAEHIFSSVWGQVHRSSAILSALLSSSAIFGTYCISTLVEQETLSDMGFGMFLVLIISFHAYNIWANWSFICSAPEVLQLMCGKKRQRGEEQQELSSTTREGGSEQLANGGSQMPVARGISPLLSRGRCLFINCAVFLLALAGVIVEGISFDTMYWTEASFYHVEVLLTALMASCLVRAITSLVTVTSYGAPPPRTTPQMLVELMCESILLLVGISGCFHIPDSIWPKVTASLALLVLLFKVFDVIKASPIDRIMELLSTEGKATAPQDSPSSLRPAASTEGEDLTASDSSVDAFSAVQLASA